MTTMVLAILILALVGAACCVAGIYLLAGSGFALVTAGVWSIIGAFILSRGLNG